ncbi:MAG: glycosyltransferase, partial [Cyanobacteria bacterium P01_C01_bin.118]
LEKKNSGTIKDALYYFQQATRLNPQLATAYLQIGIVLRDDLGHLDKAVTYFTKVLSLVPDLAEAQLELGRTYQVLGNSSEAVNAFKAWINLLNPRYAVLPNIDETIPNLVEYTPPSMRFEEMLVGEHRFPKIPRVATSDKNRPFWSVVIPALNRPEYFFECLASVLAQWSGQDTMEIMVLDNGSSPPLFNIVNALGKGIIRYYRFPETVPLQENWNTMVALSRGEWVYLLQHDDYVLPGFFDRLKNSLETCPDSVGAAFTDYQNINERRKVIFTQDYGLNQYQGIVKDWVNRIGKSNPTSPPALVIRRAAYESVGGYKLDLPYTCDWEFYQRVATAYDWWHEPGFLAHYRQYSNSLTLQDSFNGVAGAAHRQAIEIAYTYLPVELRDEITQNSRRFHFDWCIQRAVVAVRHDALLGAMKLAQEALLIDTSQEANARFLRWLDTPTLTPLRAEFSRKIFPDIPPDDVRWTLETVIQIKRLEL